METLRPTHALPERGLKTHNTHSEALDAIGPDLKCCSLRSCRQGVFCPFTCKHCSAVYCSEHASPHDHRCVAGSFGADGTWTSPDDRKALVCSQCAKVVSEKALGAATVPPAARRAIDEAKGGLRGARQALLQHVNAELHDIAVRGSNSSGFSSTMLYKDEDLVRVSAPLALTQEVSQREARLNEALLAAHVHAGLCGSKPRASPAGGARADACAFKRCKTKGFRQTCKKCNQMFCLTHRLPEVHVCCAAK